MTANQQITIVEPLEQSVLLKCHRQPIQQSLPASTIFIATE
jgi:hypothetical protein